MFHKNKGKHYRRRNSFGLVRLFLSLTMMSVLALGVYNAYKNFSGIDPLHISPKTAAKSLFNSDSTLSFLEGLLSFSPGKIVPKSSNQEPGATLGAEAPTPKPTPRPILDFKFAVVADSHNDNTDLKKALLQAKESGAKFVIGLGDYTQVGTVDELRDTKLVFDSVNLPLYSVPGDHDLWDSRNRGLNPSSDFTSVFGLTFQSFNFQGSRFVLLDNSDNYTGVSDNQLSWLKEQLDRGRAEKAKNIFVFVSTPLYHPSSDHVMGKVEPKLKAQAESLVSLFKQYGVKEVFAGDTHFFASYFEPKTNLHMSAVGAITAEQNLEDPRYVMVDVFKDSSYNISDTSIK